MPRGGQFSGAVDNRLELGRERGRGIGGTLASGVPPLVALIASVL